MIRIGIIVEDPRHFSGRKTHSTPAFSEYTFTAHDQEAAQYDQQVREYESYAHDALFGRSFEYVNPHDRLLDIAIGTGLASWAFAKVGLQVYGCDGSAEMLKVCESKAFAKELKIFDLRNLPLPYSDCFFDHVICCGVLHFFGDLATISKEVLRIIKPGGTFAFTVAAQTSDEEAASGDNRQGSLRTSTPWGAPVFLSFWDAGRDKSPCQPISYSARKGGGLICWSIH